MIYSLDYCCSVVEEHLRGLRISEHQPVNLYEPVEYVLSAGGKRIRPVLALMACNLFADDLSVALMPATALEVFHNFTLLHDDVMDKADVRRGRPTVHRRWNENTAILSGDAMQIMAYQYLCQGPQDKLPALLRIFSSTALEICEGQQYDMDFEMRDDVSIDEYMTMIRLKTAVLLAASLQIGALCGGADAHNAAALYRFGIDLGLSFQIQDDLLDVYSDPSVFGKATGGDILCGKKTFLLLTALQRADEATRERLQSLLLDHSLADDEKIHSVTEIYNGLDVSRAAQEQINLLYGRAMEHFAAVCLSDPSRKDMLATVPAMLLKRKK